MEEDKVVIVNNARPLQVVEPVWGEGNDIIDLSFSPIVAWRVVYSDQGEDAHATPVTVNSGVSEHYAIYDTEAKLWELPEDCTGDSLDELLETYKRRLAR